MLAGFYEDRYDDVVDDPISRYISTFIATCALKSSGEMGTGPKFECAR